MDGNVTLWLAESVDSTDSFRAAGVRDGATTSQAQDNKASAGIASVSAMFGKLVGTSQSRTFVARADPELYEYLTAAYLDAVRGIFLTRMAAAR